MAAPNAESILPLQIDADNYRLSGAERAKLEADLQTLQRLAADFPRRNLHVTIVRSPRSSDIHVKTSLHLPKRTLFTGDHAEQLHPAWERCLRKLVQKVEGYKEQLAGKAEQSRLSDGQSHAFRPQLEPDLEALDAAAERLDYAAYRRVLAPYEESVALRVGRWIERYPRAAQQLGKGLVIPEIVEEVFLNAFEGFSGRPSAVTLGEWLLQLVDPSIRALLDDPEGEQENLSFIESAKEAAAPE